MGKAHLNNLKIKVASQVGVTLNPSYNGDITTKQAGLIGGNMVKELITHAEQNLSTSYPTSSYPSTTFSNTTSNTNWTSTTNSSWF